MVDKHGVVMDQPRRRAAWPIVLYAKRTSSGVPGVPTDLAIAAAGAAAPFLRFDGRAATVAVAFSSSLSFCSHRDLGSRDAVATAAAAAAGIWELLTTAAAAAGAVSAGAEADTGAGSTSSPSSSSPPFPWRPQAPPATLYALVSAGTVHGQRRRHCLPPAGQRWPGLLLLAGGVARSRGGGHGVPARGCPAPQGAGAPPPPTAAAALHCRRPPSPSSSRPWRVNLNLGGKTPAATPAGTAQI